MSGAFKNVALPSDTWVQVIGSLQALGTEAAIRQAGLIREQVDGEISVKATTKSVRISAKRGGDIRASNLGR